MATQPAPVITAFDWVPNFAKGLVRDLRDLSDSLRQFSDRMNNDGALGVLGPEKLPDYKPGKTK